MAQFRREQEQFKDLNPLPDPVAPVQQTQAKEE
jgi:hypothetical protein